MSCHVVQSQSLGVCVRYALCLCMSFLLSCTYHMPPSPFSSAGALGNARYKPLTLAIMQSAYGDDNVFPVVSSCKALFEAMHCRDLLSVAALLMKLHDSSISTFSAHTTFGASAEQNDADDLTPASVRADAARASASANVSGSTVRATYLEKAQKLCSDILSLQRDAFSLRHLSGFGTGGDPTADLADTVPAGVSPAAAMAIHEGDLAAVEQFLLGCGVCGYSGPEMFNAVECRQTLVQRIALEKPQWIRQELPCIQARALLTNLMISRDLDGLDEACIRLRSKGDENQLELAEFAAAQTLLSSRRQALSEVSAATKMLQMHHHQHRVQAAARRDLKGKGVFDSSTAGSVVEYHETRNKAISTLLIALSNAAYTGIPIASEAVTLGYTTLLKNSNDARILLFPLLQAMRSGNLLGKSAENSEIGLDRPCGVSCHVMSCHVMSCHVGVYFLL